MNDLPAIPCGILAIDTSTDMAGLALSTGAGITARSWLANRAQTTTVLPEVDRLLAEHSMQPADIHGLVVATGPGTFTGLRVGLAIAKGIVASRAVPLVGVPTLDIVFALHAEVDLIAVLPAGRGRVVWQRRHHAPRNMSLDEFAREIASTPETLVVGELPEPFVDRLSESHPRITSEARAPEVLLRIGATRIVANDLDDPVTLEPTYLHGVTVNAPVIEDRLTSS